MREILFRGKRENDGQFVYGSFMAPRFGAEACIVEQDAPFHSFVHEVIPETVGQFTGLTDKNGKKIFEGDIVEGHCHSRWRHDVQRCEIAYGRDGFEARRYVQDGGGLRYYTYKVLFSKDVAVIGNIHDNPELLEVSG